MTLGDDVVHAIGSDGDVGKARESTQLTHHQPRVVGAADVIGQRLCGLRRGQARADEDRRSDGAALLGDAGHDLLRHTNRVVANAGVDRVQLANAQHLNVVPGIGAVAGDVIDLGCRRRVEGKGFKGRATRKLAGVFPDIHCRAGGAGHRDSELAGSAGWHHHFIAAE